MCFITNYQSQARATVKSMINDMPLDFALRSSWSKI